MSQHRKRKRAWRTLFPDDDDSLMKELETSARHWSRKNRDDAADLLQEALRMIWMNGARIMRYDDPWQAAARVGEHAMLNHRRRFVLRRHGIVDDVDRDGFVDRIDWAKWARRMENAAPDVVLRECAKDPGVVINRALIERTLWFHIFDDEMRRAA